MAFSYTDLPLLNALLNCTSTVLLIAGYFLIRKKNQQAHKACMSGAVAVSAAFLISYLVYHFEVGSVGFKGVGTIRTVYFSILISHTILAATLPVLVPITLFRALKQRFPQHKKLARITFPIWLYVSVTGVLIYIFLYKIVP